MTIFKQAEQLKYSMELPFMSKESVMLLDGIPYQCGSDYSPEYLNQSLQELTEVNEVESLHENADMLKDSIREDELCEN